MAFIRQRRQQKFHSCLPETQRQIANPALPWWRLLNGRRGDIQNHDSKGGGLERVGEGFQVEWLLSSGVLLMKLAEREIEKEVKEDEKEPASIFFDRCTIHEEVRCGDLWGFITDRLRLQTAIKLHSQVARMLANHMA